MFLYWEQIRHDNGMGCGQVLPFSSSIPIFIYLHVTLLIPDIVPVLDGF